MSSSCGALHRSLLDFQTLYASAEWRTYIALHATFMSLAEGELRDQVQATLAQSERGFIGRVAATWELLCGLFGYRLRPELGANFETLATLLSANVRGLTVMALSLPDLADNRAPARPFGAASEEEWSLPALGAAAIASAFLEPGPAVTWDEDRVTRLYEALSSLAGQRQVPAHDHAVLGLGPWAFWRSRAGSPTTAVDPNKKGYVKDNMAPTRSPPCPSGRATNVVLGVTATQHLC
jgi:hypothetical protein